MNNRENTELKTVVPTWGMVGKNLVLDAGRAMIPILPRILDKILDYPVHAMLNVYGFHMNRRGDDLREYGTYKTVYCGKYIKDGEPVSYRQGESERFFNGKENERIPGKREEEHYDTDERKLEFLQRYGWLMDDEAVRAYSARFKPMK